MAKGPATTNSSPKIKPNGVVLKVKRRKRKLPLLFRPGIPNLTKELTEPPPEDDEGGNKEDDDLLFPLDEAIPCDTLIAFQSLLSPDTSLSIPLQSMYQPIPTILESQLLTVLQQSHDDHESLQLITTELNDLLRQNVVRRLASTNSDVVVLLLTQDYIRGVWDALDVADTSSPTLSQFSDQDTNRVYVQWFVNHLQCWTGRVVTTAQLQHTWQRSPPMAQQQQQQYYGSKYSIYSLKKALECLQHLQVILPKHDPSAVSSDPTYQLWLPQWGLTLKALHTAQTRLRQKLQQSHHQEFLQKTFHRQGLYHQIATKFLTQWMQDTGQLRVVSQPAGNFLKLIKSKKSQNDSNSRRFKL